MVGAITPQAAARHLPARPHPAPIAALPLNQRVASRVIPGVVVAGCIYGVVSYIGSQLRQESAKMNKMFAQQNTPEVEAHRRKNLAVEVEGDPRHALLNVLNW